MDVISYVTAELDCWSVIKQLQNLIYVFDLILDLDQLTPPALGD